MARNKRELSKSEREQKTHRVAHRMMAFAEISKQVRISGVVAMVCITVFLCVRELAGTDTNANLDFDFGVNVGWKTGMPWVVALIALTYGLIERRFRITKTATLAKRTKELETDKNPNRKTSNLKRSGKPKPEDR